MQTKVKKHTRKKKNGVSVVKEHPRKTKKGCDTSKCSTRALRAGERGEWGQEYREKAHKELVKRGKDKC